MNQPLSFVAISIGTGDSIETCKHGNPAVLCRECQLEQIHDKKAAKKRTPIKALKNRSEHQERLVAKGYVEAGFPKAKRQIMSGAISTLKGDVDPGQLLLVECKQTRTGRMIINPDWLEQVEKQSKDMGRAGFYALHSWVSKNMDNYKRVVVVSEPLWFAILSTWAKENA